MLLEFVETCLLTKFKFSLRPRMTDKFSVEGGGLN